VEMPVCFLWASDMGAQTYLDRSVSAQDAAVSTSICFLRPGC